MQLQKQSQKESEVTPKENDDRTMRKECDGVTMK